MKRALVTGGSGAIGAALCRKLGADGHHVLVHGNHRLAQAESVAAAIIAAGGSAQAIAFDVADAVACGAALEQLLEAGAIQIVVNNAGIHDDAVMPGMRHEQWAHVIDVSLNGFFNVTQPLLMPMMRGRWARIVNISSVMGVVPARLQCAFTAAKAAPARSFTFIGIPFVALCGVNLTWQIIP